MKLRYLLRFALTLLWFFGTASAQSIYTKQELLETSAQCLECHDDKAASLESSLHRICEASDLNSPISIGCISCHDGWKEHVDDPSADNIKTAAELEFMGQAELCSRCHNTPHQVNMMESDPHGRLEIRCTDCHTVHSNTNEYLVKDDKDNYCVVCHTSVATEFKRRSAHPLESGNVRCVDCHKPGENQDNLMAVGLDWLCQSCHTDYSGPFVYEHPVVNAHLVQGGGCTECHQPHGSPNDRLLNQPGDGICYQCHSKPPTHFIAHDGIANGFACVDCHSDIHGSFDNSKFLDPMLGAKMPFNCFDCHVLGN